MAAWACRGGTAYSGRLSYDKANDLTLIAGSLGGTTADAYDATNALVPLLSSQGTATLRQGRWCGGRGLMRTIPRASGLAARSGPVSPTP